jgi:tetratricopeptide (TPR) repeat protein
VSLREWWLRLVERRADRERLRRRALAATGLWLLLSGFLAALGFGIALVVSFALLLLAGLLAGGLWLLGRYRVQDAWRAARRPAKQIAWNIKERVADLGLPQHLQRFARVASHRARILFAHGRRSSAEVVAQLRARASRRPSQALRLNGLGAQLRREGSHEQAVEQHRAALEIARELGDERAEALTLNRLAIALAQTDGVGAAVQHFEQALVVFRRLGDEEHEGRVMANLGFVHRRQGRDEHAEYLFHAALDKLPPESPAYRQVEEQLQRAS